MCRSLSSIRNVSTIQIALFHSRLLCMRFHPSTTQWPVWASSEKETEYQKVMLRGEQAVQASPASSRPGHTEKVANGCWGLIDCFASRGGACEAGWLWLGTWNKVNEVTTGVVAGRPGWGQNVCWLLQARATYAHLQHDNRVYDSDRRDSGGFGGLRSVTAYMRHFPEKLATSVATASSNVLYGEGNSVYWSQSCSGRLYQLRKTFSSMWDDCLFSKGRKEEVFWLKHSRIIIKCLLQRIWVECVCMCTCVCVSLIQVQSAWTLSNYCFLK